ncbi:PTS glucitol/sorbitol transporter subunit IIA [Vagococcus carniphilus]|uniref:PTS glucitol/sorbitol transporter subunit IIA n=1 Tax=Vagococcus carniphilus TaxID=218144 RepID=UPI0028910DC1|nr:PTS glucitol/sorbitol transporter subunit IIA [Vagococcus carniphilus]MDT2815131.1 PTS glucitol/sorbitol transporter subunit IIA [Vagococcus carniphilus]MDT2849887.1 PTS glucitol/sorbitol transporter subunit IIA [Vagococcus carniphilus]MDT2863785.1 PTS glucitol/sorbitol transporter subunit IIA [Vagococcus carniphilus]
MESVVMSIGKEAISQKEPLLILFNESATEELRKFSVIQQFKSKDIKKIVVGDCLFFDDQKYTIKSVGPVANQHLEEMGHVSIVFKEAGSEDQLANALYVEPFELPNIKEGTVIRYA